MTQTSQIYFEATPESVAELARLRTENRRRLPRRFSRRWRCNRHDCDGLPHDGRQYKHARSSQVIPSDARVSYIVGGRGSGKTWASSHNFAQVVLETEPDDGDDHTEWAVIGPIFATARDVMIEGPSGLIRAFGGYERDGGLVAKWDRTYGHLRIINGALIYADSADEGAIRIQGKNLYGALCGEIGLWRKWQRAWEESIGFAVRKGPAKLVCDGTPKRSSLAKFLLDDATVWRKRLRTVDNLANLAAAAVDHLLARYQDTRLGQQELEGLLVDDVEGALWRRANIDEDRVHEHIVLEGPQVGTVYWERADGTQFRPPPFWLKVIVALDPADGTEDGDEQGIAVIGQSADDHELYVLHSDGLKVNPFEFLSEAVDQALLYRQAHIPSSVEIVMEKNHGGKYLLGLMDQVLKAKGVSVPYRSVDANASTGGKRTRAEDVSGLYERHKVHHVGTHADLEDQLCLVAGTLVTTASGEVPIECVTTDDRVLTRKGWRRVLWSGQTGTTDRLVCIEAGDTSIECTPAHPVFVTGEGYVPAQCVVDRSLNIAVSGTTSTSSTATRTGDRAARVALGCFTESSGKMSTAVLRRRAGTSITRTRTRSTGSRTTSPFSRLGLTRGSTDHRGPSPSRPRTGHGNEEPNGPLESPDSLCVLSAAPPSSQRQRSPSTAPRAVSSVSGIDVESVPVYNLTVQDEPEFFANGILVHNCTFTGMGNEPSPDRMDALVWALKQFVSSGLSIPDGTEVSGAVPWADASGIAKTVYVPPAPSKVRELPNVRMW